MSAADALEQIRLELAEGGREVSPAAMQAQGVQTLTHLHELGIIMYPQH